MSIALPILERTSLIRSGTRAPVLAWISAAVLALYVLVAIFGPVFLRYNPVDTPLLDRLKPPGAYLTSGAVTLLGTDGTGRDIFAQLVYGARTSMIIAAVTVAISFLVGLTVGLLAGYFGGVVDAVLGRIIDTFMAFPGIVLAIVIAGLFERGIPVVVFALSATGWISFARLTRASAQSIRSRDWVDAARVLGVNPVSILARHVLPFVLGPVGALVTIEFGLIVLAEAGLSFLGIGLPSSAVSWGQSIANGRSYLATAWWISAFPGVTLAILLVAVGLLGDYLNSRARRTNGP